MSEHASKILRTVPREKAFYFFTSIGNYTGISASSLKEFMEKINEVNVKSLEFHLQRRDFEKWIAETLEDKELANEIESLRIQNYTGNLLKERLYNVLAKHYEKLTRQL
ncbi:MAG: DUF5752 family protein [Candidatus Bathyarchaeia archaeon]